MAESAPVSTDLVPHLANYLDTHLMFPLLQFLEHATRVGSARVATAEEDVVVVVVGVPVDGTHTVFGDATWRVIQCGCETRVRP